jgi:uncharacterized protein
LATLVDTSGLVVLADADQIQHRSAFAFIESTREALLVPVTVLPEADYMLTKRLGPRAALAMLRSIAADEFRLEQLSTADLSRSLELMSKYADSSIGLVDASIVAMAERLGITRILTLDRRHFGMIRPRHCAAFELVP